MQRQTNKNNDLAAIFQGLQKKITKFRFLNPVISVKTTPAQTQERENREKWENFIKYSTKTTQNWENFIKSKKKPKNLKP